MQGSAIRLSVAHLVEAPTQYLHVALLQRLLRRSRSLFCHLRLPTKPMAPRNVPVHYRIECEDELTTSITSHWCSYAVIPRGKRSHHSGYDHLASFGMIYL